MTRSSGVLLPMFSLPSPYGIGTMGKAAYEFIDFLKASGQKYWQLLPLGPTDLGDSPYSSPSTFAGNPYLIDLDILVEEGLLTDDDVKCLPSSEIKDKIDYDLIKETRLPILHKAYETGREKLDDDFAAFVNDNSQWIGNYTLYMALKNRFEGKSWVEWPEDIRKREKDAMENYSKLLKNETDFYAFIQFLFFRQWNALRSYAIENGISFIGDMPIYVAMDSADVWSEPWFFQLDENYMPKEVSGCPPDDFTEEGQLWGNPLYDYDRMQSDGFGWWIRRIEGASRLYDVLRIDHFRGLESYWAVPYGEKTAKNGYWKKGPGMALVGVLTSWFYNLSFIAEDLGLITPAVAQLLSDSGLPGMKVLQFAFDSENDSFYLPHSCQENSVCFVGTHDNDTVLGWLEDINENDRQFAADYMHITDDEGWPWGMIRTGMGTSSVLFVVAMQDILELSGECRMNTPGIPNGNWRWRMLPDVLTDALAEKLFNTTKTYRRINK
jgi:4-alpha-glucanotransferase